MNADWDLNELPTIDATRTQVIRLSGNMRSDSAAIRLDQAAARCVHPGRRRVVLDLYAVEEADTRSIATIINIIRRTRIAHVACSLIPSGNIRLWLSLYKLDHLLEPACPLGSCAASKAETAR